MRLFAAIELDDHARAAIAAHQQLVRGAVDTGRDQTWIPPARMHLTLAFLGDVKEPYSSEVIRVIGSPLDAIPFTLRFGGVGAFRSIRSHLASAREAPPGGGGSGGPGSLLSFLSLEFP